MGNPQRAGERGQRREPIARAAFSIAEFCIAHGISRKLFYTLAARGEAPKVLRLGDRRIITAEARADWLARLPSGIQQGDERHERAKRAAAASAARREETRGSRRHAHK